MFRVERNMKSSKSGERFDFKFSNLQALQVPKGWDKLLVSIISVETGKTITKSNKALVRNGNCQWTESLSESLWISSDDASKDLEEHLFKFVVSMGSARSGILGEATVNISSYMNSRASAPVSLPLKKCNYGTILQVKIQCLTPKTKLRAEDSKYSNSNEEVQDADYDITNRSNGSVVSVRSNGSVVSVRSNGSVVSVPKIVKSPSQEMASASRRGKIGTSFSASSSNRNVDSAEQSMEKEILYRKNGIYGTKVAANSRHSSLSMSNNSSFKSRITHSEEDLDSHEQEFEQSPSAVAATLSLANADSSKNLLEAAEDTIEELRDEAKMWERNAQKLMLDLDILRERFSDQSKKLADTAIELSAAETERNGMKKEIDGLKLLMEESMLKQKASNVVTTYQSESTIQLRKELEREIKFQRESNADLSLQLKRSQNSNLEFICILQELEETTEKQKVEIDELLVIKSKFIELEKSIEGYMLENQSLLHQLQDLQESEENMQANIQVLEQALADKIVELENERTSNSHSVLDLQREHKRALFVKEEEIMSLQAKLSDSEDREAEQAGEIEALKEKVHEVERDCSELTSENLALFCKLKECEEMLRKEGREVEERDNAIAEAQKKLEDFSLKVQLLESSKIELEDTFSNLGKEMADNRSETEMLQANLLSKKEEIDFLRQNQVKLEARVSDLTKEKDQLQENMELVERESNITSKCLDELRNDLMVLSSSVDSHVSANEILERKSSELEKGKREVELHLFEMEEKNLELLERLSGLEAQLKSVTDEYESTQLELDNFKSATTGLQDEIRKLDAEKMDLKQKLQDKEKVNKQLQEDCAKLEIKLVGAQEKLSTSSKKIDSLEGQISSMLEEFVLKEKCLTSELDALRQENWHLKEKVTLEESLLNQLYLEKTAEIENFQRKVEELSRNASVLLKEKEKISSEAAQEISGLHAEIAKLENSLKEVGSKVESTENELETMRMESELKVKVLEDQLSTSKQSHEKLVIGYEKKLKLLAGYRSREEKVKTSVNDLELKVTVSEYERQQLIEEAANLKALQKTANLRDEVPALRDELDKLKIEKENIEASLCSVTGDYEDLKAENISLLEKISSLQKSLSMFDDCKRKRMMLEENLLQLESDLAAKDALCAQDTDLKNELSRIKSGNLQYQLKIQLLEGEKNECLKRVQSLEEDLKMLSSKLDQHKSRNRKGDHDSSSQYATDYVAKIEMLEAELDEALDANNKYRIQLQRVLSEGRSTHSGPPRKLKAEDEVVPKERYERTKSSLETELKDLRDRYLEMSLKYAEVEAEREDLVMKLKSNKHGKRRFHENV